MVLNIIVKTAAAAAAAACIDIASVIVDSIDSSNQIWLTFDKEAYVAGDLVSGFVHLNCLKPFQAKGIILKVSKRKSNVCVCFFFFYYCLILVFQQLISLVCGVATRARR